MSSCSTAYRTALHKPPPPSAQANPASRRFPRLLLVLQLRSGLGLTRTPSKYTGGKLKPLKAAKKGPKQDDDEDEQVSWLPTAAVAL